MKFSKNKIEENVLQELSPPYFIHFSVWPIVYKWFLITWERQISSEVTFMTKGRTKNEMTICIMEWKTNGTTFSYE